MEKSQNISCYCSKQWLVCCFQSLLLSPLFSLSAGSLDESGKQVGVHQEYVFLFGVFDEKESKYKPNSYAPDKHVKYTINGFTEGSLPGQSFCHSLSLGPQTPGQQSTVRHCQGSQWVSVALVGA